MANESLDNKEVLQSEEDFKDVYQAHADSIYKFIFWRTKNVQLSEDLTSTTFQKAWAARKNFKGGSAQAWLFRIARNTLFDYWRKNKEITSEDIIERQEDDRISTAELLDKESEIKELQNALSKLPKDMRSIIELRFIEGLSSKQVAERLNMTDGNVRIIQYRALKKLREYLL
jgi:RNA polymerase sigma-70 factor (ECF subfamily)